MKIAYTKTALYLATILLSTASIMVLLTRVQAQQEDDPIYDQRCVREQTLSDGNTCYVTGYTHDVNGNRVNRYAGGGCKRAGNTESFMDGLEEHCENSEYDGDFLFTRDRVNIVPTIIVLNEKTIPPLLRMILTVVFSIVGITLLVLSILGYIKWMTLTNSGDDVVGARKMFTNAFYGVIFCAGAVPLTWILFYALGYRGNPFDIEPTLRILLRPDCSAINSYGYCNQGEYTNGICIDKVKDVCEKYDVSCAGNVVLNSEELIYECQFNDE